MSAACHAEMTRALHGDIRWAVIEIRVCKAIEESQQRSLCKSAKEISQMGNQ